MNTTQVRLVFPHQLFKASELLLGAGEQSRFILVEEYLFFRQYKFHKQKLAFHRASMKCYEDYLVSLGHHVTYIEALDERNDVRQLIKTLNTEGIKSVVYIDPTDDWLSRRIQAACAKCELEFSALPSPLFLNQPEDLKGFFRPDKKKFFQTKFYTDQRIQRNLLVDENNKPLGGKWSFDAENRKKYPKGKLPPPIQYPDASAYYEEAKTYVETRFGDNPGMLTSTPLYPLDHQTSSDWLKTFLEQRLAEFGTYEDAIVSEASILNHSVLTPMLNVGLLTPDQIIQQTLIQNQKREVPMNSLEGFIRQIVGWREFIRGVYECKGREERTRNFWGFKRKIPASFYDGTTGIAPVDITIKKVLQTGYCHHIERLMVLGNFMLLCEFDPDEVYRWFMELFIDAYDWVMVPNVYGMSQFADGGLMSTKPYISGSNYLMKMSNYQKGEWQGVWDALFWRFMHVHRDFFLSNPRIGMLVRTFDKFDAEKQEKLLAAGEAYLVGLD